MPGLTTGPRKIDMLMTIGPRKIDIMHNAYGGILGKQCPSLVMPPSFSCLAGAAAKYLWDKSKGESSTHPLSDQ